MHYLYILRSNTKRRTYIGITCDISKRIVQHNSGNVRSTRGYRPLELIHIEEYKTKKGKNKRDSSEKNSSEKESLYKELGI
ncbi:MAG: GIY-YIG nuclease family protein [Patescibacteria group bacterium]